jgi:hypothetical protein
MRLGLLAQTLIATLACFVVIGATARAQPMDLALHRLRVEASSAEGSTCSPVFAIGGASSTRQWCPDDGAWRSIVAQLGGSLVPSPLGPPHARGMRGLYVGIDTSITPVDSQADYWKRGSRGSDSSVEQNRAVDPVLAWQRLTVRKGLPLGFELGANAAFAANTSYWAAGGEVRWALFEGLRQASSGVYYPELAVRGAVQTLLGDRSANVTVPAVDVSLGGRFVIDGVLELSPYGGAQVAWIFADSGTVDLTPDRNAWAECNPDTTQPSLTCRGDSTDLNHDVGFSSVRSTRVRGFLGLQMRVEWFALTAAFSGDLMTPHEVDGSAPASVPRQWRLDVGLGVSY